MTQSVDFPTHNGGNTLDLVLCNDPNIVLSNTDLGKLGSSDQHMILTKLKLPMNNVPTTEQVPDYAKADFQKLRDFLDKIYWFEELGGRSYQDAWDHFSETIDKATADCIPTRLHRCCNRPLWMNRNMLRMIRKKRRLWKWYCQTRDYAELRAYKKVEQEVQLVVRRAKRDLERKLAKNARKNPKAFYAYLNNTAKSRPSIGPLESKEDKDAPIITHTSNVDMANVLNSFFLIHFHTRGSDKSAYSREIFSWRLTFNQCAHLP